MTMSRRVLIAIAATLIVAATATTRGGGTTAVDRTFTAHYENVLGTSLELRVHAPGKAIAERVEQIVLTEITRQARILSTWDPKSEVSQWLRTQGQPVRVSRELFEVLDLFDQWRSRSNGVIDPASQAVIALWSKAAAEQRLPTDQERAAAVTAVRQPHWRLDRTAQTATHLSTTPLVLASFTKSYIMDRAVEATQKVEGLHGLVLNIGGDILARGAAAEPIDIANPRDDAENSVPVATILVRNRTVATSGDYRRGVDIGRTHYSHIVDPRTALPATAAISATVVADRPTDAGALATAFTAMTPSESIALAASVAHVEYLLITPDGKRVTSHGWPALEAAARPMTHVPAAPAAAAVQAQAPARGDWDASMELAIDFEIPTLTVGNYKRPFIAFWIEDADRFPLRTIALWYHEDRWLTESKAWYRADRLRNMSETTSVVRSIGAATRPPGKYTLKWDGKDNAGRPVKAGTYTVLLESVREHGGYQIIRQEMRFSGSAQHLDFKPGAELGAVSFDYRKVAK
jgi:thiamine biosynthesis lipoprotein ApbE